MGKLFGTDGIRGLANVYPMDSETMMMLGRAAACVFRRSGGRHRILIGKDTRLSGYMLETALASGIVSMGVDVLLVGPMPTPGIAFMTRSMRADAGVVISASHNNYVDNGIKFFGPDGFKLADETESEMERLLGPGHMNELRACPDLIGKAYRIDDAIGRYTVFLKSCIERNTKLDGLKLVIDAANGAAYRVAPLVFSELGAEVIMVGDDPNGTNINEGCGSTHPERMCELVREHNAFCGIAYDGDADRVIFCDENGQVVDGDAMLAALAVDFQERGILGGSSVVATVMSNIGLDIALKERGIGLVRAAVGDRYVLAQMLAMGAKLGGEQSGHMIALDYNTTGDGILTSLLLLAALIRKNYPVSYCRTIFQSFPQLLVNVPVPTKPPIEQLKSVIQCVSECEQELGERGRVLVRYSGTESKLRVMVESETDDTCRQMVDRIVSAVCKDLGVESL